MSYANIIMLGATLPTYESPSKDSTPQQDIINADDPTNAQRIANMINSLD